MAFDLFDQFVVANVLSGVRSGHITNHPKLLEQSDRRFATIQGVLSTEIFLGSSTDKTSDAYDRLVKVIPNDSCRSSGFGSLLQYSQKFTESIMRHIHSPSNIHGIQLRL